MPACELQPLFERRRGEYLISTDPAKLDIDAVSDFLARSYWANSRSRETIERSISHSLCFGIYRTGHDPTEAAESHDSDKANPIRRQVAFARVVTDYATFAWLCDVFVDEEFRGIGLGKWLVETTLAHPELQGLRRWMLATADAHALYRSFGFGALAAPERWMDRFTP